VSAALAQHGHQIGLLGDRPIGQMRADITGFGLQIAQHPCVINHRLDLAPVAHDAGVGQQAVHILIMVKSHAIHIEVIKGRAEPRPFVFDHRPAEPGLKHGARHFLQPVTGRARSQIGNRHGGFQHPLKRAALAGIGNLVNLVE
jgi:hypothetical protein